MLHELHGQEHQLSLCGRCRVNDLHRKSSEGEDEARLTEHGCASQVNPGLLREGPAGRCKVKPSTGLGLRVAPAAKHRRHACPAATRPHRARRRLRVKVQPLSARHLPAQAPLISIHSWGASLSTASLQQSMNGSPRRGQTSQRINSPSRGFKSTKDVVPQNS